MLPLVLLAGWATLEAFQHAAPTVASLPGAAGSADVVAPGPAPGVTAAIVASLPPSTVERRGAVLITPAAAEQPAPSLADALVTRERAGDTRPAAIPRARAEASPKPQPSTVDTATPKLAAPSRATSEAPAKEQPRVAANDPDVELLSALMQHMGTTAGYRTLAERVGDCHRGDRIEALLCQRRVCAGAWGIAKACPAYLAPAQAMPANAPRQPG